MGSWKYSYWYILYFPVYFLFYCEFRIIGLTGTSLRKSICYNKFVQPIFGLCSFFENSRMHSLRHYNRKIWKIHLLCILLSYFDIRFWIFLSLFPYFPSKFWKFYHDLGYSKNCTIILEIWKPLRSKNNTSFSSTAIKRCSDHWLVT